MYTGTCYLSAVILTGFPDLMLAPLMPLEPLPSYALASGATAARVEAAWLVMLGSCCGCLADASGKGNLAKSDTYKCESRSQFVPQGYSRFQPCFLGR